MTADGAKEALQAYRFELHNAWPAVEVDDEVLEDIKDINEAAEQGDSDAVLTLLYGLLFYTIETEWIKEVVDCKHLIDKMTPYLETMDLNGLGQLSVDNLWSEN